MDFQQRRIREELLGPVIDLGFNPFDPLERHEEVC